MLSKQLETLHQRKTPNVARILSIEFSLFLSKLKEVFYNFHPSFIITVYIFSQKRKYFDLDLRCKRLINIERIKKKSHRMNVGCFLLIEIVSYITGSAYFLQAREMIVESILQACECFFNVKSSFDYMTQV